MAAASPERARLCSGGHGARRLRSRARLAPGRLNVPCAKELVKKAPSYDKEDDRGLLTEDPDGIHISREKEKMAYEHYGVEPLRAVPEEVVYVARFRAWVVE